MRTKKLKKNYLICYKLKHYMLIDEKKNENKAKKNISEEQKKFDQNSLLIKNIDVTKLINQILLRFNEKSFIFYLCVRNKKI